MRTEIYLNNLASQPRMEIKTFFTKKKILFMLIFFALVLVSKKINFSPLVGAENQFFTLFQFFGPIAGSFLGPVFGIIAVLFAEISDFLIVGKEWSIVNLVRVLPMLFAVMYFGLKAKRREFYGMVVPALCILAFVMHPVGGVAWIYTIYWIIPIVANILPKKFSGNLLMRSLGATLTAHAVGSVIWIYTIPMGAEQWFALVPIVGYERLLFALGVAGSYVVFNTTLDYVITKWKIKIPSKVLFLDKRYALLKNFSKVTITNVTK